jgi:pilus assembly protein FimV
LFFAEYDRSGAVQSRSRSVGVALNSQSNHTGQNALKRLAVAGAVATLLGLGSSAWALSLGRLNVQSALGESLRAEIDVTSLSSEEAANLRVRIAPADAYRVAGIDYNPVLPQTRVTLQRRADGSPYLSIVAERPVQEPFVDVILEMTWSTGRLLREYTLLFDPPAATAARAPAPTAPQVSAPAPAVAAAPAPAAAPADTPRPATARASEADKTPRRQAPAKGEAGEYRVKPGDTLSRIAARVQPEGVSLDQMLAGLFRSNAQAFSGSNMNRLRAGAVLTVPSGEQLGAVDGAEARQLIQAQSADFEAYRRRLAGAVPEQRREPDAPRAATGKVKAEVEDRKQAQTPTPDRLRLDKGKTAAAPGAASAEDLIAKERAAKDASARASEIERNMAALKKLQAASAAAPASKPVAADAAPAPVKPGAAPAASAPMVAVAPAPAPAPVAASAPLAKAPDLAASLPVEPASAAVASASEPMVPASAPEVAAASAPASAVMPPVVADEEPSLLESLTSHPLLLPGAGLIIALLAGLGYYRLRGKRQEEAGVTSFLESRLQPDSFFGASGGQRVDTRDAAGTPSSMSYSLSQIDAIGDVDPVAEADVYLAYGRDLQAEEILKEAMRSNPDRLAIRSKLLEVYAKRRDVRGFELLAGELYGLTGGQGEDWARAQELGRSLDPENPLYEPGGQPLGEAGGGAGNAEPLGATTMPQSIVPSPSRFEHSIPDLDLDDASLSGNSADVDLDVSAPVSLDGAPSGSSVFSSAPINFEESASSARADLGSASSRMDFELQDLPDLNTRSGAPSLSGIDLGGISLDLNAPSISGAGLGLTEPASGDDDGADPLLRKLELAEEFHQIGDFEGARDLLQEVVQRAEGPLKARAQALLDQSF